jgi:hypothetical protein
LPPVGDGDDYHNVGGDYDGDGEDDIDCNCDGDRDGNTYDEISHFYMSHSIN